MLSYSKEKWQKYLSHGAILHSDVDFSVNFLKFLLARHFITCSFLPA